MSIQDLYCDKKTGRIYVELFGKLHWIVDYTCGAKHWISSMAAMEHYQFNGPRFPQEPQDMIVADNLLRLAQDGKQISV